MIIHSLQEDTTSLGESSPYDSVWSGTEVPVQQREGLEKVMLQEDKLYVVLAVVLIIWMGIIFLLFRTDRKIDRLERNMTERISEKSSRS
jgi:hypothetical protein